MEDARPMLRESSSATDTSKASERAGVVVPRTDAAIILSVTALLVALIVLFLLVPPSSFLSGE